MYKDARDADIDQQIIVSNDSDLEPALKLISLDTPEIILGLIIPRPKLESGQKVRPPNKSLSQHVHWTRGHILDEECEKSQLDDRIATNKKPVLKPNYW
jgi:hypothetical protein